jgi:hypothetical protein
MDGESEAKNKMEDSQETKKKTASDEDKDE